VPVLGLSLLVDDGVSMHPLKLILSLELSDYLSVLIVKLGYHLLSLLSLQFSLSSLVLFLLDSVHFNFNLLLVPLLLSFHSPVLLGLFALLNGLEGFLLFNFSAYYKFLVNSLLLLLIHEHFDVVLLIVLLHFFDFGQVFDTHHNFTLVALNFSSR